MQQNQNKVHLHYRDIWCVYGVSQIKKKQKKQIHLKCWKLDTAIENIILLFSQAWTEPSSLI